jgi:PAS domain S-box-containing protein
MASERFDVDTAGRDGPMSAEAPKGKTRPSGRAGEDGRMYRLIFENNPLPMWVYDLDDLRILAVNHAAIETYGYSRDEFLSMTIRELRPQESQHALTDYLATPRSPLQGAGVWLHRRKDGSLLHVEITSHELPWEGRRARLVMANDVTERERQARALEESEARKSAILQSAMDCIITIDEQGRVTAFNPAAEKTFGYGLDDVLGRELADLIIPEELRERHRQGLRRFLSTSASSILGRRIEMEAVRASGERFPVELTVVTNQHGGRTWFTGFLRDITQRKQAQSEILELTHGLEQKVIERTQQLDAANKELEAFSYSVSHDLRAPLRAIDGFSQALVDDFGDRLDDQARHYLGRVRAATQRMGALIDDLLDLARVSRSKVLREQLNLSQMAEDTEKELHEHYPERRVEVEIEPDIVVHADRNLLKIIIDNLLSNAWKYTSKRERAHVRVGTTEADGDPVTYVSDDGAGFDMRYAGKLFGAFQRLHSPAEFEGNGIGLATVQRIVNLHGGRVWAEGRVDEGATFFFTLGSEATHE